MRRKYYVSRKEVNTDDKSRTVAFILCLFGGWLGLHYFYVGRIGKGLLYLLTFGLLMIGWVIDLFAILLGNFKDNEGDYI